MKLGSQTNQAKDRANQLMAELKSTNLGRKREIVHNIIEGINIIEGNLDSLKEEAINGDKITSRITLKRRRLKQQSGLNKCDKLIKRNENEIENDDMNESKQQQQQQQQNYIYQSSPSLLFSHQSNAVKVRSSYNQPISDAKVVASCCCCRLDSCSNEYTTNMGIYCTPRGPNLSLQNDGQKGQEEEEKCTEERLREANKSSIRNKRQDNVKLMFKRREPKFNHSSVFILFSIISLLFSKQNTQRCDIGRCESKFIMEALGKC